MSLAQCMRSEWYVVGNKHTWTLLKVLTHTFSRFFLWMSVLLCVFFCQDASRMIETWFFELINIFSDVMNESQFPHVKMFYTVDVLYMFSDMTAPLEISQFPLVEVACTTSVLICLWTMVNRVCSTSGWMGRFSAQLLEMVTMEMTINKPHAVVWFNWLKVICFGNGKLCT